MSKNDSYDIKEIYNEIISNNKKEESNNTSNNKKEIHENNNNNDLSNININDIILKEILNPQV